MIRERAEIQTQQDNKCKALPCCPAPSSTNNVAYCKIYTCLRATSVREPVVCTTNHSQPLWLKTTTVYPSQSWRVAEPYQVVLGFHLESMWLHSPGHSVRLAARRLSSHSWGLGWGDGGSSWGLSLSRRSQHHHLHPVVAGSP